MSAVSIEDIRARLQTAFVPTALDVTDEGHLHIGHAGEGTGHFRVRIAGAAFEGKTRVQPSSFRTSPRSGRDPESSVFARGPSRCEVCAATC